MPNVRATELARQILDDLRGATYYADPKVLGGLLKGTQGTETDGERRAVEVLRYLLHQYAPQHAADKDIEALARTLESSGIR